MSFWPVCVWCAPTLAPPFHTPCLPGLAPERRSWRTASQAQLRPQCARSAVGQARHFPLVAPWLPHVVHLGSTRSQLLQFGINRVDELAGYHPAFGAACLLRGSLPFPRPFATGLPSPRHPRTRGAQTTPHRPAKTTGCARCPSGRCPLQALAPNHREQRGHAPLAVLSCSAAKEVDGWLAHALDSRRTGRTGNHPSPVSRPPAPCAAHVPKEVSQSVRRGFRRIPHQACTTHTLLTASPSPYLSSQPRLTCRSRATCNMHVQMALCNRARKCRHDHATD